MALVATQHIEDKGVVLSGVNSRDLDACIQLVILRAQINDSPTNSEVWQWSRRAAVEYLALIWENKILTVRGNHRDGRKEVLGDIEWIRISSPRNCSSRLSGKGVSN